MEAWRALLYAVAVFVSLGIIALIVAVIMKILYSVVHRKEKKPVENKGEAKVASQ